MGLLSHSLLILAAIAAVAVPIILVIFVWKVVRAHPQRLVVTASVLVVCVIAQCAAVAAIFLKVNDEYQFYTSFGDLLGQVHQGGRIVTGLPTSPSAGRVELLNVDGKASHTKAQVLVWLPQQYDQAKYRTHRFPLVEFLPGQPNTPSSTFERFNLAQQASQLIDSGRVKPFVLVLPPLMIRPPYDTECTNVPHGPKAYSWLSTDVTKAISTKLRVTPPGRSWALMGWSTGGFCAAKLLLRDSGSYGAAVSLGGYYRPTTIGVYPHLLGKGKRSKHSNSPQYQMDHYGLHGRSILVVAGRQDGESWPSSAAFVKAARYFPGVSHTFFPMGGHNIQDYGAYVPQSLLWLHRVGVL